MPRPSMRTLGRGHQRVSSRRGGRTQSNNSPQQQLARKLADKPVGKRPDDSDDSDKLVTKVADGRRSQSRLIQEVYASGAVAGADKPGQHPTRAQRKRTMDRAMQSAALESGMDPQQSRIENVSQGTQEEILPSNALQPSTSPAINGFTQSIQTSPSRDTSVLEGFKPRKRQPSILRTARLDSSTFDLSNDSFALPDDESTPLQHQKRKAGTATPDLLDQQDSASRKRKRDSSQPMRSAPRPSAGIFQRQSTPGTTPAAETSLPPQSISALRASGQKQRRQSLDANDEDIMAPPLSSSSSSSPAKPASSKAKLGSIRPHIPTTKELQPLMPSKRRKQTRHRSTTFEFEVPLDSASDAAGEADDSFQPPKRQGKRRRAPPSKSKPKSAKPNPKTFNSRPLQPVRSSRSNTAKLPTPASFLGGSKAGSSLRSEGRSGGSLLKDPANSTAGKENEPEVLVGRSDSEAGTPSTPIAKEQSKQNRSKWDDIDAFEMDFEDVTVYERSSDVNAR